MVGTNDWTNSRVSGNKKDYVARIPYHTLEYGVQTRTDGESEEHPIAIASRFVGTMQVPNQLHKSFLRRHNSLSIGD